ncbi:MAG: metallophosphoesterase [Bacteroidales bacterium]|nr:metallophosphoesterase [Bacteroidales bacterium]
MRSIQFLVFFSIVISIHLMINFYIFSRGLRSFETGSQLRTIYVVIYWFLALSYIVGRVLERYYLCKISDFFTWTGSFWLAAMLYLFLIVGSIDLIRLINHFVPFIDKVLPAGILQNPRIITYTVAGFVFLLIVAGHINAIFPRTHAFDIDLNDKKAGRSQLKIAVASDIHLGTIIANNRTQRIVNKINESKPDVILLAGDVVDEDLAPVIKRNLGKTLTQLNAPLGVYAITGNHEYIGGVEPAVKYLNEHGIKVLRDTMIELIENVYVAGREDIQGVRFGGKQRKSLKDIIENKNDSSTLILLDHQPAAIDEAIQNQVDLMLSGHTHHGQLWPLSLITKAVYQVSWGLKKFGNTNVYVSSGIGSWGPPVRIGNRPEIVVITLHFN